MTTPRLPTPTQRPLAAACATLCAAGALLGATPLRTCAAHATSPVPTSIVGGNCNDSGTGSLRETIRYAANAVTIDMTQLSCAHITLTSGALEVAQAQLTVLG